MNIETANRLLAYRKKFGYSQEQLAEKLGLSRQAVSKWERAEASPDTDNLIELARLYGVSLDELVLGGELEESRLITDEAAPVASGAAGEEGYSEASDDDSHGVDVSDAQTAPGSHMDWWLRQFPIGVVATIVYLILGFSCHAWHPGWLVFLLIPVVDSVFDCIRKRSPRPFAYAVLCAFVYLLLGFYVLGGWAWGWIVFITIPLWDWITSWFRQ